MLRYDEADLIACFGDGPEYPEDELSYWRRFALVRDGLRLVLEVDDSDAAVMLFGAGLEAPVFEHRVVNCPSIRADPSGFELAAPAGPEWRDQLYDAAPVGLRVRTRPQLAITLVSPRR